MVKRLRFGSGLRIDRAHAECMAAAARKFPGTDVRLVVDGRSADVRSLTGHPDLTVAAGRRLKVQAAGPDAAMALDSLIAILLEIQPELAPSQPRTAERQVKAAVAALPEKVTSFQQTNGRVTTAKTTGPRVATAAVHEPEKAAPSGKINEWVVTVPIGTPHGIHARVAAELTKLAEKYKDTSIRVSVRDDSWEVNAKSSLGWLTLAAEEGSMLKIRASGPHAVEAAEALARIASGW